jgi:hypothetical protein
MRTEAVRCADLPLSPARHENADEGPEAIEGDQVMATLSDAMRKLRDDKSKPLVGFEEEVSDLRYDGSGRLVTARGKVVARPVDTEAELVKLTESLKGQQDLKGRDREVARFTSENPRIPPLYGTAARLAEILGGREYYEKFRQIMAREHLNNERPSDVEYGMRATLLEEGMTVATAETLSQAMLLAEHDAERLRFAEPGYEKQTKGQIACEIILTSRPDLLENRYGSRKVEDDALQMAEGQADPQEEIDQINDDLASPTLSKTRRAKLIKRLHTLCKSPTYGPGAQ